MKQLNAKDWHLLYESGFLDVYPKLREEMVQILKAGHPLTPSDLQDTAQALMTTFLADPRLHRVRSYAADNGLFVEEILYTASIRLRDDYLKRNPGLKTDG